MLYRNHWWFSSDLPATVHLFVVYVCAPCCVALYDHVAGFCAEWMPAEASPYITWAPLLSEFGHPAAGLSGGRCG